MALDTFSIFYYGLEVTANNNKLNFIEPVDSPTELTATIDTGTYSFARLLTVVGEAMTLAGVNDYTLTLDRQTRLITITSTNQITLLTTSGAQSSVSIYPLIGFSGPDFTGSFTFVGNGIAGSSYEPQFKLQDYTPATNFKRRQDPSVNQASSGIVETISFGVVGFYKMSFQFITNLTQDGKVIKNRSGVTETNDFMGEITKKGFFEFMPDISDRNTFSVVILESVAGNRDGTGYELKEMVAQNLPGYFNIGSIELREF